MGCRIESCICEILLTCYLMVFQSFWRDWSCCSSKNGHYSSYEVQKTEYFWILSFISTLIELACGVNSTEYFCLSFVILFLYYQIFRNELGSSLDVRCSYFSSARRFLQYCFRWVNKYSVFLWVFFTYFGCRQLWVVFKAWCPFWIWDLYITLTFNPY